MLSVMLVSVYIPWRIQDFPDGRGHQQQMWYANQLFDQISLKIAWKWKQVMLSSDPPRSFTYKPCNINLPKRFS